MEEQRYLQQFKIANISFKKAVYPDVCDENSISNIKDHIDNCWDKRDEGKIKQDTTFYKEVATEFFNILKNEKGMSYIINM